MARTVTLAGLRSRIREQAEVREVYLSDSSLSEMVNASIADLYAILVEANPDRYITSENITVVAGTDSYAIASGHYKTMGVDYVDGTNAYSLRRFSFGERNKFADDVLAVGATYIPAAYTMYRDVGQTIKLVPSPTWSGTIRHWYIPVHASLVETSGYLANAASMAGNITSTTLTLAAATPHVLTITSDGGAGATRVGTISVQGSNNGSTWNTLQTYSVLTTVAVSETYACDASAWAYMRVIYTSTSGTGTLTVAWTATSTFDGVAGWDQWVVWDVTAKCLIKEESDPRFAIAERDAVQGRILREAVSRDDGEPDRVRDTSGENRPYEPYGYYYQGS